MSVISDESFRRGSEDLIVFGNPTQLAHRALVIQSVCEIESDLCVKIADFFVGRNGSVTREEIMADLYGETGLLGSLSRIAKIAFYLGFIDRERKHDLGKLAKLRNRYGHDKNRRNLDNEPKLYKLLTDTYLYRKNADRLSNLPPQKVFLVIKEQIIADTCAIPSI